MSFASAILCYCHKKANFEMSAVMQKVFQHKGNIVYTNKPHTIHTVRYGCQASTFKIKWHDHERGLDHVIWKSQAPMHCVLCVLWKVGSKIQITSVKFVPKSPLSSWQLSSILLAFHCNTLVKCVDVLCSETKVKWLIWTTSLVLLKVSRRTGC